MIMTANNATVADSLIARFFSMEPESIEHLRLAAKEGVGPLDLDDVGLRGTIEPRIRLRPRKAPMDYVSLTFGSRIINKMIMVSSLSPLMYRALGPFRSTREVCATWGTSGDFLGSSSGLQERAGREVKA